MKICNKCSKTFDDNSNFCQFCGGPLETMQPVYQPQFTQNVQIMPQQKPSLGLKITAMVLSITGFSFLVLGFVYTLIGLVEPGLAFGMAFAFALFFLPLSIVGFALSIKCRNAGDVSAFSRVGKILGLIGIILAICSLFIGLVSLGAGY